MITLFQNYFPKMFDPWTLKEEISLCNAKGECGYERLKDFGIFLVDTNHGDIEIAKNGVSKSPHEKSIAYSNEGPKVLPKYYSDISLYPFFAGSFVGIDIDEQYIKKVLQYSVPNLYQGGCCAPYDYQTKWKNKTEFISIFTRISKTQFTQFMKYDLTDKKISITESAIKYFETKFHVYGNGFSKFPSFRGEIGADSNWQRNKLDILAKYKFNICLENSDFDRYVTEKIMHSLIARSIPVYYGTESVKKLIPLQLLINIRDFENLNDCWKHIQSMTESEIQSKICDIDSFVSDPKNTYPIDSLRWADEIVRLCKNIGVI